MPIDLRDIVDKLMLTPKELAGIPHWVAGPRTGQSKWKAPLSVAGEVLQMDLIVIAYPQMPALKFSMMITCEDMSVSRMDYGVNEEHNNGYVVPEGIKKGKIKGPHLHRWLDNRSLATHTMLPDELEFAREIPATAQGYANAFRWFCGEHNVIVPNVPDYPMSELLI